MEFDCLTRRESDVMRLVAEGRVNKEIAGELGISVHTVNDHLKAIFRKLGVSNRAGATAVWLSTLTAGTTIEAPVESDRGENVLVPRRPKHLFVALGGLAVASAVVVLLMVVRYEHFDSSAAQPGDLHTYIRSVQAPPEQQAALADGFITHEEHEGAIQRTIACATDAGVRVQPMPGEGLRPTRLGFVSADETELRDSEAKLSHCVATYLSVVESVRAAQPVDEGTLGRSSAVLAECMNSRLAVAGFTEATVRTEIDNLVVAKQHNDGEWAVLRAWDECRSTAEAQTGFHS